MDLDGVGTPDITSCHSPDESELTHVQRDAETVCGASECLEVNGGLATTVSHEETPLEHEESERAAPDEIILNKAEKPWRTYREQQKTWVLYRSLRSILNKLTPQMFQRLMKRATELTIDTEERLKGVIDLIFEKAVSEPLFSVAYANMCCCFMGLKVPAKEKPGTFVNFRKLLLNRCQNEFEKDKDEVFEKKQKELEASSNDEERQRLREELEEAKDKALRRSLGNIKFIGELFKLKMLTGVIMHDCVVKLLKNYDEESLECVCLLLSTVGKDLDFEKAQPRMDQYYNQLENIVKERKTSTRIRFKIQDVLDLRQNNWVPRRGDQGPKTIDQIHKEAEMEEHREQMKVQQTPVLDFNNHLLAVGGKGMWGSWRKGSKDATSTKPADIDDIQRNKAEKAWKPYMKKGTWRKEEKTEENNPEQQQKFQQLMKQVMGLNINSEEKLKEVIDQTFEEVISEPDFSMAYAKMCHRLKGLKVPATDKPGTTVNFRKILLIRCQKEFEMDRDHYEIFEKKQKELEAASSDEERQRLTADLEEARDKAQQRSLGNAKFTGELFKVKMLKEVIMHDRIVKLLINHDEDSLECLCCLLSTIGKDLDLGKAKPRMDQYFNQLKKIIKERKTSSRIGLMLQDVLDLRQNNWVPKRGYQAP